MKKRLPSAETTPTANDLARAAGVSLATVDRVLNSRPGVRHATVEKVNKAIAEPGYVRDSTAANFARRRVYNLLFILPQTSNEFVKALEEQIASQSAKLLHQRTSLRKTLVPLFDPQAIVVALDALDPDRIDGVAVVGPATPAVRDAVKCTHARGIATLALVSDLPRSDRDYFVGIDTVAAELSTHLQGHLVAVHPAYDIGFDGFAAPQVRGNPAARQKWAVD